MKISIESGVAILKKGSGYWDTTNYGYGGKFGRVNSDTKIHLTGNGDTRMGIEFRIVPLMGYPTIGWTTIDNIVRQ